MKIYFLCTRWGSENLNIRDFIQKTRSEGYEGAEFLLPDESSDREAIIRAFKEEILKERYLSVGQTGMMACQANRISGRQQEPAGTRKEVLPVASETPVESLSL